MPPFTDEASYDTIDAMGFSRKKPVPMQGRVFWSVR